MKKAIKLLFSLTITTSSYAMYTPMDRLISNISNELNVQIYECDDIDKCTNSGHDGVFVSTYHRDILGYKSLKYSVKITNGSTSDGKECSAVFGTSYSYRGNVSAFTAKLDSHFGIYSPSLPKGDLKYAYNHYKSKGTYGKLKVSNRSLIFTPRGGGLGTKATIKVKKGKIHVMMLRKRYSCIGEPKKDKTCKSLNKEKVIERKYSCIFQ